jgi:hypothetical protein
MIIFVILIVFFHAFRNQIQVNYVPLPARYIHPVLYHESNRFQPYYQPNDTNGIALRRCKNGHCELLQFYEM